MAGVVQQRRETAWAEASVRPQKRDPLEHGNGLFSPVVLYGRGPISGDAWYKPVRPQKRDPLEHGNGLFSPVDSGGVRTRSVPSPVQRPPDPPELNSLLTNRLPRSATPSSTVTAYSGHLFCTGEG